MSTPAACCAATTCAVASATAVRSSASSTGSPRLRRPCSSASALGRGRLPEWVVRIRSTPHLRANPIEANTVLCAYQWDLGGGMTKDGLHEFVDERRHP